MQKFLVRLKSFSIKAMVVINIMAVGAIAGAYAMHSIDTDANSKTAQAIQAALKTGPVAQADASPKANGR